jgi:hypothetical protein
VNDWKNAQSSITPGGSNLLKRQPWPPASSQINLISSLTPSLEETVAVEVDLPPLWPALAKANAKDSLGILQGNAANEFSASGAT